jgi:hypothetical protein
MDHHRRVLEQRVQSAPIGRDVEARKALERVRDEEQQKDEEEDARAEREDVGASSGYAQFWATQAV